MSAICPDGKAYLPNVIYFLRPIGMRGPIKIGYSTWPPGRLHDYMKWSPFPLEIVATIRGGHQDELRFHTLFAAHHSHNEWFHASPELERVIAEIQAGTFDRACLPEKAMKVYGRAGKAVAA